MIGSQHPSLRSVFVMSNKGVEDVGRGYPGRIVSTPQVFLPLIYRQIGHPLREEAHKTKNPFRIGHDGRILAPQMWYRPFSALSQSTAGAFRAVRKIMLAIGATTSAFYGT